MFQTDLRTLQNIEFSISSRQKEQCLSNSERPVGSSLANFHKISATSISQPPDECHCIIDLTKIGLEYSTQLDEKKKNILEPRSRV